MAAGDISVLLFGKIRFIANESSAGFWTDANLYKALDSAQNLIYTLLQKQDVMSRGIKNYEIESLKPLIKLGTITISSSSNSISLSSLTDLIELYNVSLYNSTDLVKLYLNYVPLNQLIWDSQNTYGGHSYDGTSHKGNVFYSLYNGALLTSFVTMPNTYFNRCDVMYYYKPTAVASGVDPVFTAEVFEAMIEFALYYAYTALADNSKAGEHFKIGLQLINNL